MIKIAIADDHPVFIEGLITVIEDSQEEIEIVGTAENGDQLLDILQKQEVDIAILDIGMPGMREEAATLKQIRKEHPAVKVLILTMYLKADKIKMMIYNGAKGYVLKNKSGKQAVDALKTLNQGKTYFPDEIRDVFFESEIPVDLTEEDLKRLALTHREEEVLRLIPEGLLAKEIADKLHIAVNTVESHKTNLMKKTGSRNVQDLVRYAIVNGYYLME